MIISQEDGLKFIISIKILNGERDYPLGVLTVDEFSREPAIDDAVKAYGAIAPNAVKMIHRSLGYAYVACKYIAEGSTGAEIGVDRGDGIALWLHSRPTTVHGVDPWESAVWDEWFEDTPEQMDKRYNDVLWRFKDDARVVIHRARSEDWFGGRPDDSLDWCFIDGDHRTEPAYRDLVDAYRCVRNGGYVLIDDTQCRKWAEHIGAAVDKFLAETKCIVLYRSTDPMVIEVVK